MLLHDDVIKFSALLGLRGSIVYRWVFLATASDAELWCFRWFAPEQTIDAGDLGGHRANYDIIVMEWGNEVLLNLLNRYYMFLVALLDQDGTGGLGPNELQQLFGVLFQWKNIFATFDVDFSGTIDQYEFDNGMVFWLRNRRVQTTVKYLI